MSPRRTVLLAAVAAVTTASAWSGSLGRDGAEGDPRRGADVFAGKCAVCHSTTAGWNKEGPSLAGVFGRRAGSAPDFTGYRALRGLEVVWDAPSLDAWLADPKGFSGRNSAMAVKLADGSARADVIAYLRSLR